jgi:hypothetical protein
VFDWPKDQRLVVPGLGNETVRAYPLAEPGRILTVARRGSDVWIAVPDTAPDPIDSVVALEIRGAPVVYKAPRIQAAADIFVKPLEVKLVASAKGLETRYTTDGTEPGEGSEVYRTPLVLGATTTVRARAFHEGRAVSGIASATYTKVDPVPPDVTGVPSTELPRGAICARREGSFDKLPDLGALAGERVDGLRLAPATAAAAANRTAENVALRFRGAIELRRTTSTPSSSRPTTARA